MSLVPNFWQTSEQFETERAFIDKELSVNFAEFKVLVKRYAAGFQKLGLRKGDAILLAVPVSIEFYIHLIAAWYLGLRVVITSDIKDKVKTKHLCKEVNVRFVITTKKLFWLKYLFLPMSLWNKTKVVQAKNEIRKDVINLNNNDVLLITTTSGTTGDFKIAFRTEEFLMKQFKTIQEILETQRGDVHLSSFPVVLLCNLLVGVTSVILPNESIPAFVKKLNHWHTIQLISASPYFMQEIKKGIDFNNVGRLIVGGASLFKPLVSTLKPWAAKTKLIYGATEVEPIAVGLLSNFEQEDVEQKGVYVGKVHGELSIRILNPINGIGEIAVSGAHVLPKEYLLHGEDLYQKIDGRSFYLTGDLGYLKNDKLYFYGRKKYAWLYQDKMYSPILCEKWNAEHGIFKEASMLQFDGKHTVFYVGSKEDTDKFKSSAPFVIHDFVELKKMPKDKSHNSRIVYQSLLDN